jgi:hypothetical protein
MNVVVSHRLQCDAALRQQEAGSAVIVLLISQVVFQEDSITWRLVWKRTKSVG